MFVYDSIRDEYNEVITDYESSRSSSPASSIESEEKTEKVNAVIDYQRNLERNFTPRRLVRKRGQLNIFLTKIPYKHLVYIRDLGNTLLGIRWRWILLTLILVNFISFFIFAILWMWLAYASGDFEAENIESGDFCVVNTSHLTGYFLLSVETITTIGFGYRYPTEKCNQGWILTILQSFFTVAIQGTFVSVVYVKLAKPRYGGRMFSKKAVICLRDGKLCFIIRIVDSVGKVSVGTNITLYFVDKDNFQMNPVYIQQMTVQPYGLLLFPLEIVHVIDERSPLWNWTPYKVLSQKYEIIVRVEGSSIVTGQLSQHRSSYIGADILWGHRFCKCVQFYVNKMTYVINFEEINKTMLINTALCSAQQLTMIRETYKIN